MPTETGVTSGSAAPSSRALSREVLALAVPAFATLVAEPLMLMVDAAVLGHVSTEALAGVGIAASIITVPVGLCIFLAYGTTASVARQLGAGHRDRALWIGLDGLVLGMLLGVLLAATLSATAPITTGWYPATPEVADQAATYLRIVAAGLLGVLTMLAATGVLRGLQDTRTPLWVAIGINLANAALNLTLVLGAGLGVVGAAIGTAVAQLAGGAVLAALVVRRAHRAGVRLRVDTSGLLTVARHGGWLVLRTASLQVALTTTAVIAAGLGTVAIAAHQITNALWSLLAMALDAIAIAAQAIIGRYLGAGEAAVVRTLTARMIRWGVLAGLVFGVVVLVAHPLYVGLFSPDPAVQAQLGMVLVVVAVATPVSAAVFVLDGVLIGAGDARYLALAGGIALACYLPLALTVAGLHAGLVWLWAAYTGYMVARLATLAVRARGTAWLRLGG